MKLIFAGYTGSKNQVWNKLKIQSIELDFSKLIFQKSSTDQQGLESCKNQTFQCSLQYFYNFDWFFFSDLKVKTDNDLIKKEQLTVTPTSSAEESAWNQKEPKKTFENRHK